MSFCFRVIPSRPEIKLATVAAKIDANIRNVGNRYLVGVSRDLHVPLLDEVPFALPKLGIHRYAHSYNSMAALGLLTVVGNRNMIMYGSPGLGKSQLALLLNKVTGVPDDQQWDGFMVGSAEKGQDMFGHPNMQAMAQGRWEVEWSRFTGARNKFMDEISRNSGYGQGLLLSMLSERVAVYQSEKTGVPIGPFLAAANALNGGETFGIIPALRSRIDVGIIAAQREYMFSNDVDAPRIADYDPSLILTDAEMDVFRKAVEDLRIERQLNTFLNALMDRMNSVPYGLMTGEDQSKSGLYGKYEAAVRAYGGQLAAAEAADLAASVEYQINTGFSDRQRQSIEWYSKAAAVLVHREGTRPNVSEAHIAAMFPHVGYGLLVINSLAQKANQDKPIHDEIAYLRKFQKDLWEKVKRDESPVAVGNPFGSRKRGASSAAAPASLPEATVDHYQQRWGLTAANPMVNFSTLRNQVEALEDQGNLSEAISTTVASLLAWDGALTVKTSENILRIKSGLQLLDYLVDVLEGQA